MSIDQKPKLLSVLDGQKAERPPVWFMRQAGRYLPEYRAVRATEPTFIDFCLNPEKAAEVTLQPMRRFPYDAAIVFADILLIPQALGQKVWFEAGEGPKLGELPSIESMRDLTGQAGQALGAVGETLSRVRSALEPERTLIGFAGAPWTVATYMIEGGSSDRSGARTFAYQNAEKLDALIQVLVDATIDYLAMQAASGAQVLKLFESWAEGLSEPLFDRLVTKPHTAIIEGLRAKGVTTPIIGFPRGAGTLVEAYARLAPVQGVALDTQASAALGQSIQKTKTIQGALDPLLLRAGGDALLARVDQLLEQWGQGPTSSTWVTASCPTRRSPMSRRCWPGSPASDDPGREEAQDRRRPVQSGRARRAGRGAAVPVQPVPRQGDHRPAGAAALSDRRPDRRNARQARQGKLRLMGGGSPLLPETEKQARALEADLAARFPDAETRCFIAMRYWKPLTDQTAKAVKAFAPDEVVLLPLYPQYSTTTTGSSLKAWKRAYRKGPGRVSTVCCYPVNEDLVQAHADLIKAAYDKAGRPGPARLLFSAHGLPEKVILAGDPYQQQIEATAAAVAARLGEGWDWRVTYQSRVGPMKWIGPSTEDEIRAASQQGLALVVTPIAFVSEHIETLVELDHEYRQVAFEAGCPVYVRVPALGVTPGFIGGLGRAIQGVLGAPERLVTACAWRCGGDRTQCPNKQGACA
jgi:uroporphyrinogen decarboxylase